MWFFIAQVAVYVFLSWVLLETLESHDMHPPLAFIVFLVFGLLLTGASLWFWLMPLQDCASCSPDYNQHRVWVIILTIVAAAGCYIEGRPQRRR